MTSSSDSTSAASPTDLADVSSPIATIPYQAIISGSKVTMFVLSSPNEAHQVLSPSLNDSSIKLQPLLRLCIDHPLCTMTTSNANIQYNISCYDAHVDLAIGGRNYSCKFCTISQWLVCMYSYVYLYYIFMNTCCCICMYVCMCECVYLYVLGLSEG